MENGKKRKMEDDGDYIRERRRIKRGHYTLPEGEKERAEMALESYNYNHGTKYRLVCSAAFVSHEFGWDRKSWVHFNFTAATPSGSGCLFFAEMHAGKTAKVTCCKILEGRTRAGCDFCSAAVTHPGPPSFHGHGGDDARPRSPELVYPEGTAFMDDCLDYYAENYYDKEWGECASMALEYYNKKNGTDYEPVDGVSSHHFKQDAFWNHCNFRAKLPSSDAPELFAAELNLSHHPAPHVTACVILDAQNENKTKFCYWCRGGGIKHPKTGFLKGYNSE